MKPWPEQIAVVTGAGSGIGRAIAQALAAEGTGLCLLGRRLDPLREVVERTAATRPFACAYQVDLGSTDGIAECVARIRQDVAGVDLLVHSAGIISLGRLDQASAADLDRLYAVNVRGPYLLTQALLPIMPSPGGQVVFMNSSAGLRAREGVSQYAASKHALRAVADSLREEVNDRGIRVTSVFLGRTASPMQAEVHASEGRPYTPEALLQPEDLAAMVLAALTLPWTAEVTDLCIRPMRKP